VLQGSIPAPNDSNTSGLAATFTTPVKPQGVRYGGHIGSSSASRRICKASPGNIHSVTLGQGHSEREFPGGEGAGPVARWPEGGRRAGNAGADRVMTAAASYM
jgi:hypothetical protein